MARISTKLFSGKVGTVVLYERNGVPCMLSLATRVRQLSERVMGGRTRNYSIQGFTQRRKGSKGEKDIILGVGC